MREGTEWLAAGIVAAALWAAILVPAFALAEWTVNW